MAVTECRKCRVVGKCGKTPEMCRKCQRVLQMSGKGHKIILRPKDERCFHPLWWSPDNTLSFP